MSSFNQINLFMRDLRRRLRRTQAIEGGAILVLLSSCLVTVAFFWAWVAEVDTLPIIRLLFAVSMFVLIMWLTIRDLFLPWLSYRRDEDVAAVAEERVVELQGRIRSCVELQGRLSQKKGFTVAMVHALARETAEKLSRVRPDELVTRDRCKRLVTSSVVATLVLLGAFFLMPQPFIEGGRALLVGVPQAQATHRVISSEILDVAVGDITFSLVYPAYTRLPLRVVRNSGGDIKALIGTRVAVETQSLVSARTAQIVFHDDELKAVELVVREGGRLTGEFLVTKDVQFHFEIIRKDGVLVVESAERNVEAVVDEMPEIELLQPTGDVEFQADDPIKLMYSASDDFGMARIDLVTDRHEANSRPVRRRVKSVAGERSTVGEAMLDVAGLRLDPGEFVECWLEANDNNSIAEKPGRAQSRKIRIKRYSAVEQHNENIENERKLVEFMIDVLADRLESPIDRQKLTRYDQQVDVQSAVSRRTKEILKVLNRIVQALLSDPLAKLEHRVDLEEIAERHQEMQKEEAHHVKSAMGESRVSERAQHLVVLFRTNETAIAELELDIPRIDKIIDHQNQLQLVENARDLKSAQEELAKLIEEYKKTKDPALRMQIQAKLARLIKALVKLRGGLAKNAKPMPLENMNMDALQSGEQMQAMERMQSELQNMQELLREGKLDQLTSAIERMSVDMQTTLSSMEGDLQEMASATGAENQKALRKLTQDLDKAINRQDALHHDTEEIAQRMRERLSRLVRRELAPQMVREMERIQKLSQRLARINPQTLHADDARRLSELRQEIEDLRETLSQEDLSHALNLALKVRQELHELHYEVDLGLERLRQREGENARVRARQKSVHRLNSSKPKAREIVRNLKKMLPAPQDLLDGKEQKRLMRLVERQKRVRDGVQSVRDQLDKVGLNMDGPLKHAQDAMNDAHKRLSEYQPTKAEGHERAALNRLRQARKVLEQAMGKQKRGKGGVGVSGLREKVAIPDADRYQVPRAFRDELLKAIKGKAPNRYQRLIERYYEALIQ
ncbi:MAG TPA: DUF4175 family protein [Myxococcales bacterium]|nr:DUF4175 family protein [Myxococcales bacterium]HIN85411.1 DUF4175 family protein [Myxococcales bacterium]